MQKPKQISGFSAYIPLVRMLAQALGQDAVVTLYRFVQGQPEIACAYKDCEKTKEEPLEAHLLSDSLHEDYLANAAVVNEAGHTFRASVAVLRDAEGAQETAIAVRFDTSRMSEAVSYLQSFLRFEAADGSFMHPHSIEEMVENIIDEVMNDNPQIDTGKRSDKMEMVSRLEKRGVFLTRGAVEKVSDRMGIAQVTVYSYLDEIRKRRKAKEKEQSK